jgi:hypothetical protein
MPTKLPFHGDMVMTASGVPQHLSCPRISFIPFTQFTLPNPVRRPYPPNQALGKTVIHGGQGSDMFPRWPGCLVIAS